MTGSFLAEEGEEVTFPTETTAPGGNPGGHRALTEAERSPSYQHLCHLRHQHDMTGIAAVEPESGTETEATEELEDFLNDFVIHWCGSCAAHQPMLRQMAVTECPLCDRCCEACLADGGWPHESTRQTYLWTHGREGQPHRLPHDDVEEPPTQRRRTAETGRLAGVENDHR